MTRITLWYISSNCSGVKHSEQDSKMKIQQPQTSAYAPPWSFLCYLPQMLTSATTYLPFPQYLEKQPGVPGMRLLCPRAGHRVLLPGETAMPPGSASPLPLCPTQKRVTHSSAKGKLCKNPFPLRGWKSFAARFNRNFCYQLAELAAFSCLAVADRELLIASLKSVSCSESTP